jgi:hypothetical protein
VGSEIRGHEASVKILSTLGVGGREGVLVGCPERGSYRRGGERQDVAEVLRVAGGHVDDGRVYGHALACCGLRAAAADRTDVERDLVAAPSFVARSAEHVAGQGEQEGVVVQAGARRALQV